MDAETESAISFEKGWLLRRQGELTKCEEKKTRREVSLKLKKRWKKNHEEGNAVSLHKFDSFLNLNCHAYCSCTLTERHKKNPWRFKSSQLTLQTLQSVGTTLCFPMSVVVILREGDLGKRKK
jgi:hypothetical protein